MLLVAISHPAQPWMGLTMNRISAQRVRRTLTGSSSYIDIITMLS